jgi:hypothetical protein
LVRISSMCPSDVSDKDDKTITVLKFHKYKKKK